MSLRTALVSALSAFFTLALIGCGVSSPVAAPGHSAKAGITGLVHGGQQPVSGATVQLYTVGTTGDGSAATPLLTASVKTDASGSFSITGLYSCTNATEVYITAAGGDPGLGRNNPNLALMTALGPCSSLTSSTFIVINELTTVAAASALAPYAQNLASIGSASGDVTALNSAFTTAQQYVNPSTGQAPGINIPAGYAVPVAQLNTLADIVATCINSGGGTAGDATPCGTLFNLTTPPYYDAPTDTFAALLNVAAYPYMNTEALYNLYPASVPFQPILSQAPPSYRAQVAPPAAISVSPGTLSFPATTVRALSYLTTTLTNNSNSTLTLYEGYSGTNGATGTVTGPALADYAITSSTCNFGGSPSSLAAGASCALTVRFAPTSTGTRNAFIGVYVDTTQTAQPTYISLTGTAVPPSGSPKLTLSQTVVNFAYGGFTHDVTVTNSGGGLLTPTFSNTTSSFYTLDNCVYPLTPGASCKVSITDVAPRDGLNGLSGFYDTVTVSSEDAGSYNQILLSAHNLATVTYTNVLSHSYPAYVLEPVLSGAAPTNSNGCSGDYCNLMENKLTAQGDYFTSLNPYGTNSGTRYMLNLPRNASSSGLFANVSSYSLGNSTPVVITLTNSSNSSVPIRNILSTPGFTVTSTCGKSIFAQSVCTLTLTVTQTLTASARAT